MAESTDPPERAGTPEITFERVVGIAAGADHIGVVSALGEKFQLAAHLARQPRESDAKFLIRVDKHVQEFRRKLGVARGNPIEIVIEGIRGRAVGEKLGPVHQRQERVHELLYQAYPDAVIVEPGDHARSFPGALDKRRRQTVGVRQRNEHPKGSREQMRKAWSAIERARMVFVLTQALADPPTPPYPAPPHLRTLPDEGRLAPGVSPPVRNEPGGARAGARRPPEGDLPPVADANREPDTLPQGLIAPGDLHRPYWMGHEEGVPPELIAALQRCRSSTAYRMREHATAWREIIAAMDERATAVADREAALRQPLPRIVYEDTRDRRRPARPTVDICVAEDDVYGRSFLRRRVRVGISRTYQRTLAPWTTDSKGERHIFGPRDELCYWAARGRWEPTRWWLGILVALGAGALAALPVALLAAWAWMLANAGVVLLGGGALVILVRWAARAVRPGPGW